MKHTDNLYIDIETIPGTDPWIREYVAGKVTPPGNMKKPETIEKWMEENFEDEVEKKMADCSFSGATCHIVAICFAFNEDPVEKFYITGADKEADMLNSAMDKIAGSSFPTIIGHNVTNFDLRVIRQRCLVLGIKPPSTIPWKAKPWDDNPFDTMMQWDAKNMISMDKLAKAFGVEGKGDTDGSQVWDMWKAGQYQEIADYCADDVEMVRRIYKKFNQE